MLLSHIIIQQTTYISFTNVLRLIPALSIILNLSNVEHFSLFLWIQNLEELYHLLDVAFLMRDGVRRYQMQE